jgi:hypothetical protein
MKLSRYRPSAALLISVVALFLAVGGVGYAATKIGTSGLKKSAVTANKLHKNAVTTKKIKKHAVTGAKVKDDTLTGTQIDESTLGVVPNATDAVNATNADTATTADTAAFAGNGALEFKFFGQANESVNMLVVQGATFQAACNATGELAFNATRIRATADNGIAKVDGVDENQVAYLNQEDDFDAGDTVPLLHADTAAEREVGAQADYMGVGGTPIVNANYASEESNALAVGADCVVWGTATTTAAG